MGKKGFEVALLKELSRLKDEEGINTPKVGIYIYGFNNNYQDSIDEPFDLEENLSKINGYSPVTVGFSWPSSGRVTHYLSD
jgi:esterase/lipase superfamily enzyme